MPFSAFLHKVKTTIKALALMVKLQSAVRVEPGGAYCIACSFFPYGIKERI